MRELLKELKRMGKTIIISSHILPELAELCNVVGIIERGQLLYNGTVAEAIRRARVGHVVHVAVSARTAEAAEALSKMPGVSKVTIADGEGPTIAGQPTPLIHLAFEPTSRFDATDIPNVLVNQGFRMTQFSEEAVNLETAFMRLTKGVVQ
jgi:ABC-2 type transport system ATP-binding protein